LVATELESEPKHREALPRSLRVPDDAAAFGRRLRRPRSPKRLVDSSELLVAAHLADCAPRPLVALEDHEVPDEVEERLGGEHPFEEDLLRVRLTPKLALQLFERLRERRLPVDEEAVGREDRAVDGCLRAGRDQDLHRLEELGRTEFPVALLHLLVAGELVDRFELPRLAEGWARALDEPHRDPVHEERDVGPDVLLRAVDLELAGDDELVCARVFEVEEPDRVIALPVAQVLLQRDPVRDRRVELLVRLDEARRRGARDRADRLLNIVVGEPCVELPKRGRETRHDHDLLERLALGVEDLGRDVRPAEALKVQGRRVLGEVLLVPTSPAAHVASSGAGWRSSSVIRSTGLFSRLPASVEMSVTTE
jgi:hypothetical protein